MFSWKNLLKQFLNQFIDELTKLCFVLFLCFLILSFFVSNFYIDLFKWLLFLYSLFRVFSKNRGARQKENQRFLKLLSFFKKKSYKDKSHVYKKCRHCKTVLKLPLPSHRGFNHAKCPNCGERVNLFTLKKEKIVIEVIKKK